MSSERVDATQLPNRFALPSGLVAEVMLVPTPKPDADDQYPILGKVGDKSAPKIFVKFRRGSELLECRAWHAVICGSKEITLADGTVVGEDDLFTVDSRGWDFLLARGLVPNAMV